jgi:hypothetical protein
VTSLPFNQYLELSTEERARRDELHWQQLMKSAVSRISCGAIENVNKPDKTVA